MRDTQQLITIKPQLRRAFETETIWFDERVRPNTNCLTCAVGDPRIGWGYPGHMIHEISDEQYDDYLAGYFPVWELEQRLERDGLKRIHKHAVDPDRHHVIGVSRRGEISGDFHFFGKLNAGEYKGLWIQKFAHAEPCTYDEQKKPLLDLDKADLGRYRMLGYYVLPDEGIKALPSGNPYLASLKPA